MSKLVLTISAILIGAAKSISIPSKLILGDDAPDSSGSN